MNKDQRKQLETAIGFLEDAFTLIESAKEITSQIQEEEQDKFDNLNEGMQAMESNQKLEYAAENLDTISSDIEDLGETLQEQIDEIRAVIEA